jgi:hypothetical protein
MLGKSCEKPIQTHLADVKNISYANLACALNVDMCMQGVVTKILGNNFYDSVTCKL